jgi:hypothetical protein
MEYGQAERRDYLTEIQAAHTQQEMKIQQAEEARKKADFDRKNRKIDIDTFKTALGEHTFGVLKSGADSMGLIDYIDTPMGKKGYIRAEDAAHVKEALKTNNELRSAASSARLADLTIQRQNYDDQISKLTEKGGKEAEIIKLTKDRDALSGNISKFVQDILASDPSHQAKKEIERIKQEDDQKRAAQADRRMAETEKWHRDQKVQSDRRIDQTDRRLDLMEKDKRTGEKLGGKVLESIIKDLPKLKTEADEAKTNMDRIDKMTELLDKGLGGKTGQIKAWLAPYAESMGINSQSLNDAQTYELLATTLGGSMRVAVVGPGPVSEYEQKLLQKVNAGGNAAAGAARELLKFYKDSAIKKIGNYNNSIDAMGDVPEVSKVYKKIGLSNKPADNNKPRFKIISVE